MPETLKLENEEDIRLMLSICNSLTDLLEKLEIIHSYMVKYRIFGENAVTEINL